MKYLLTIPLKIILLVLFVPLYIFGGLASLLLTIFVNRSFIRFVEFLIGDYYKSIDEAVYWNIPNIIINKLSNLNIKQMKTKYLFQALKFACLPTLSVLLLIVCGFFSVTKALDWISSDSSWAIALRILLVIGEIALVAIMYFNYEEEGEKEAQRLAREELIKNPAPKLSNGESVNSRRELYELFKTSYHDGSSYILHNTEDELIKLVERIKPEKK